MWTDGNGFFYYGQCRVGDRAATDAEVTAYRASVALPLNYTFLQFMALFTPSEQAGVVGSADPQVKLFTLMGAGAGVLQLNNPEVMAGVNYLASTGVITTARAAAILAGTPPT